MMGDILVFLPRRFCLRSPPGVRGVDSDSVKVSGRGARDGAGDGSNDGAGAGVVDVEGAAGGGVVKLKMKVDLMAESERLKKLEGVLMAREGVATAELRRLSPPEVCVEERFKALTAALSLAPSERRAARSGCVWLSILRRSAIASSVPLRTSSGSGSGSSY
jgi:hypothetical protein